MPRFPSQNLGNFDAAHNRMPGASGQKRRHNFGKQVIIAGGNKLVGEGLCLRLLPTYDTVPVTGGRMTDSAGNPVLSSFYLDDSDLAAGWGDWARTYECVQFFGHPASSFIVWDGNDAVSKYDSPAYMLINASNKAKDIAGPLGRMFAELRNYKEGYGSNSHVGSLKYVQPILFISASQMLVRPDGGIGLAVFEEEARNARIFGLNKTAIQSFKNALGVCDDSGSPMCGDLLSFDAAKLVTIIPTGFGRGSKLPRPRAYSNEGEDFVIVPNYAAPVDKNETVILGKPNPKPDQTDGGKSHSVVLHDHFMRQAVGLHEYEKELLENNVTFDEMMYVPSFEEQAEIMADIFPREALDFAWRERPDYLRVLPTGRTTVEAPTQQFAPPAAPAAPRPAARPAPTLTPPAAMNVDEIPAADDFDVAPLDQPAVPPGATIPPPPRGGSRADVIASARARSASKKQ